MTTDRHWRQVRLVLILCDAAVAIGAYVLADFLRCTVYMQADWPELLANGQSSVRVHLKVLIFLPIIWPVLLLQLRVYALRWQSLREVIAKYALATTLLALFIAAVALIFERERFPRSQIGIYGVLLLVLSLGVRGFTAWLWPRVGRRQRVRVLIVGTGRDATRLRRLARRGVFTQAEIVGHLRAPWEAAADCRRGVTRELTGELVNILDAEVVDEVLISTPTAAFAEALEMARCCEEIGVSVALYIDGAQGRKAPAIADLHGLPLMVFRPIRHAPEMLALKRGADIVLSTIGILAAGPIMLGCALLVRLSSDGPIFFKQTRSGLNGRPFEMYKFRTMLIDAEAQRATVAHLNESDGPVFKIREDPRITRFGRILRRWSLDELPQLFNVLRGDMSIVGPRPPIPAEVAEYDRWQRRRLSMRPGLTCLWQIKGRHRIGFEEWMRLDLYYIDHWSLTLDALIVMKTIPTVIGGTGA